MARAAARALLPRQVGRQGKEDFIEARRVLALRCAEVRPVVEGEAPRLGAGAAGDRGSRAGDPGHSLGRIESFEPRWEGALQAYLRQAPLNRVRDEVRRAGRRPRAAELPADAANPAPSPLEEVLGTEAVARYESALARLAEDDRAAIVARVELGCTYEEIAEALARPSPDAARMAVSRALVRLAE